MKKVFGALLICGLLTVPMAQAANTKRPKVHLTRQQKQQAKLAKKENAKARKQAQRRAKELAQTRRSV